jgi:hypothetical protein
LHAITDIERTIIIKAISKIIYFFFIVFSLIFLFF